MKDFFKKYGVLTIIVVFLTGAIIAFALSQANDVVPGKSVDGKDVLYSINGENKTADDMYTELYDLVGISSVYLNFESAVLDQAIETTDEMKDLAAYNAQSIIANFQNTYGEDYEQYIVNALSQSGYDSVSDLSTYLIQQLKTEELVKSYLTNNPDVYAEFEKEYQPRKVSHILVKMADSENPTEEEKAKMTEIETALNDGKTFAEVATEYSDDSSATQGGSLGFMTKDTNFVPEFKEVALALNEGEQTEWVKSQYGYHLIKCDASTLDTLMADTTFISNVLSTDITFKTKALWEKGEELGFSFEGNEELQTQLREYMLLEGNN